MKVLIAHNGSLSPAAAVDDLRRAGLPARATALVLRASGEMRDGFQSLDASENVAQDIQSVFPNWTIASETLSGSPTDVILNTSRLWRPDLLIISTDGFSAERSMTHNVSLEVAHRARCPVRLAKSRAPATGPIQLVIGAESSIECEGMIRELAQRQWPEDTEAQVISIIDRKERDDGCDMNALNEGLSGANLKVRRKRINGDPHVDLVREAHRCNADTIFIASGHQRDAQRFLLGSVATAVITRARSTVELVRPMA